MAGSHGRRAATPSGKRRSNASSSAFVRHTSSLEAITGTAVSRRQLRVAEQRALEIERAREKSAKQGVVKQRAAKTAATLTATGGLLLTFAMPSYAVSPVTAASTDLTSHKITTTAQSSDTDNGTEDQASDNADATDNTDAAQSVDADASASVSSESGTQDVDVTAASTKSDDASFDRADASAKAPKSDETATASDDDTSDDAGDQNFTTTALLKYGAKYFGVPYKWGGTTPSGFDCSGYTAWVYSKFGIHLPHSSSAQGRMGTRVSASEAKPGDLLWISGHVGIYAGNGRIMHAPHPGSSVKVQKMWSANWKYIRL